jgi:chemotaxis methyl-accepting protein methylase
VDYDTAMKLYFQCKSEVAAIEAEAKEKSTPLKEKMNTLIAWMEAKAQEEGLKNVPTQYGTGYWTTHTNCSVANSTEFFDFVRNQNAWELIEKRASKAAVSAYLDENKALPPGINFGKVRVFNVRAAGEKE